MKKIVGGIDVLSEEQRELLSKTQQIDEEVLLCIRADCDLGITGNRSNSALIALDTRLIFISFTNENLINVISIDYLDIQGINISIIRQHENLLKPTESSVLEDKGISLTIVDKVEKYILDFYINQETKVWKFEGWLRRLNNEKNKYRKKKEKKLLNTAILIYTDNQTS